MKVASSFSKVLYYLVDDVLLPEVRYYLQCMYLFAKQSYLTQVS
jgi:hypothetical protein